MSRPSRSALLLVTAVVAGLVSAVVSAPATSVAAASTTPGAFVGLTPARVLDTRTGTGVPQAPAADGQALHVTVGGRGGVPTDAAAVVLTLTVVGTKAGGYLSAYPTGGAVPTASVVNWATGQTVAGSATVTLGTAGQIDLVAHAGKPVDVVADVAGYLVAGSPTAAGAYVARTPTRVLDTRAGIGLPKGKLGPAAQRSLKLSGAGGVIPPSEVSAVVGTLTAVGSKTAGYLTAWADGARPTVSSLNYAAGQTVANQVTVPLGSAGGISLFTSGGPVDVLFDVTGYVIAGTATAPGTYVPIVPSRVYDTRDGGTVPSPGYDNSAAIAGHGGVPRTGVGAVVANLTATNTTSSGYLTVWPAGATLPLASDLNWAPRRTVANQASLALGRGGLVGLHLTGTTRADVVIDVSGYYLDSPPATPTGLTATVTAPGTPRQAAALSWDAPADPVDGWTIRRAEGDIAPATPDAGTAGPTVATGYVHTALDEDVHPGTTYSYALFARDAIPTYSAAATVSVTLPTIDPTPLGLSAPEGLPLPAGTSSDSYAFVWDIDCPAAGSCTGVGQVSRAGDPTHAYVLTQHGTAWSAALAPLPADGSASAASTLRSVACPDVDTCVAVGTYETTAGDRAPLVLVERAGHVSTATVHLPDADSNNAANTLLVTDVSCPSVVTCLAIGTYHSTTSGTLPVTLVIDGADVRLAPSAIPAGLSALRPAALSCVDPSVCVAVGSWGDEARSTTHGLAGRWNGIRWSWADVPAPADVVPGSMLLLGVACTAVTRCAATGSGRTTSAAGIGLSASGDGRTWTVTVLSDVQSANYGGALECRDDAACVAVYRTAATTTIVGSDAGGRTAVPVTAPGSTTSGFNTYDLACAADLRCVVPGTWSVGDSRTRAVVATVADGVPTSVQVGPVVAPTRGGLVVAARVGCAPDGSCVVTGYVSGLGVPVTGFFQTFQLPR